MDKLKSDGLITLNPSDFAVLGRFTATVKVASKLKKSAESTLFEPDFNNFARLCKLKFVRNNSDVPKSIERKKARPRWSGRCANFDEFAVQISQI